MSGAAGGDKAIGFCLSLFALMDPTTTTTTMVSDCSLLFALSNEMK